MIPEGANKIPQKRLRDRILLAFHQAAVLDQDDLQEHLYDDMATPSWELVHKALNRLVISGVLRMSIFIKAENLADDPIIPQYVKGYALESERKVIWWLAGRN